MNNTPPPFLPELVEGAIPLVGHYGLGDFTWCYKFLDHFDTFAISTDAAPSFDIDDLVEKQPTITFVNRPAGTTSSGRIDAKDIENAILKLIRLTESAVVVTTTLTPDVWHRLLMTLKTKKDLSRIIYYPLNLNMKHDLIAGMEHSVGQFLKFMDDCSDFEPPDHIRFILNPVELAYYDCTMHAVTVTKAALLEEFLKSTKEDLPGSTNTFRMEKLYRTDVSSPLLEVSRSKQVVGWLNGFSSNFELAQKASQVLESVEIAAIEELENESNG